MSLDPSSVEFQTLVDLNDFVEKQLYLLKTVQDSWQPSDFLPDLSQPDWREQIASIQNRAASLSDELLVVLVGNTITEEALPSYQTWLNRSRGLKDETGVSQTPWAIWTRGWTAEENRHGELLNRYLYLSGRVDMHAVETSTQHLIRNGFDLKSEGDPYRSIVYVSFQERATKIAHSNTGKLAEKNGDATLARICAVITADEARHEEVYKRLFARVLQTDPSAAMIAFARMMRQSIAMPARLMSDGLDRDLFEQFATVAQRSGVYTARDYADIIEHLISFWHVDTLQGLSAEAKESQDYVCNLPRRYRRKAEIIEERVRELPKEPFPWLFNREV